MVEDWQAQNAAFFLPYHGVVFLLQRETGANKLAWAKVVLSSSFSVIIAEAPRDVTVSSNDKGLATGVSCSGPPLSLVTCSFRRCGESGHKEQKPTEQRFGLQ